jgi:hypothetical protein
VAPLPGKEKKEVNTIKLYHKLLAIIAIHVCTWILLVHGWMGYATITERGGMRYAIYLFQGLTKIQYTTYNFVVTFLALQLIAFQIYYLLEKKVKRLMITYVGVLLLTCMIFLAELYFDARLRFKG